MLYIVRLQVLLHVVHIHSDTLLAESVLNMYCSSSSKLMEYPTVLCTLRTEKRSCPTALLLRYTQHLSCQQHYQQSCRTTSARAIS
jgi:hypothetical protein